MNTSTAKHLESVTANLKELTLPTHTTTLANPRIVQLDTVLNRSRFIWAREQSLQASNNN